MAEIPISPMTASVYQNAMQKTYITNIATDLFTYTYKYSEQFHIHVVVVLNAIVRNVKAVTEV